LELRCASDGWNFDLSGSVVQNGISISGTWFESVNRVGGRITGQYNGGLMEARAEGDIVAALITLKTVGARQSFLIEGSWCMGGAGVDRPPSLILSAGECFAHSARATPSAT